MSNIFSLVAALVVVCVDIVDVALAVDVVAVALVVVHIIVVVDVVFLLAVVIVNVVTGVVVYFGFVIVSTTVLVPGIESRSYGS